MVLGNFILPYGKSLWISFSQVSNFILHPVTIFIVWQPIIYIFFMILHCFEQIMQFRYFVPAAAYSKDKYRLLFRESRVPAFFSRFIAGGESDAGISIRGNLREAVTNSPGTFLLLRAGTARLQQGHFLALRAQGATSAFGLLAMTNLWLSPFYRQPVLIAADAPGPAVPSPTISSDHCTPYRSCSVCTMSRYVS